MLEEVEEGRDIFIVAAGSGQEIAVGIDEDVEGLGIGAEAAALQIAPLVAHGAEGNGLAILIDADRRRQGGLVIDDEGDEDVTVVDDVGHTGVGEDALLHLAAVDTAVAAEVDHDGPALLTGHLDSLVVVVGLGVDGLVVEVEVLRRQGWCKGADGLAGGSPKTRHHVEGEGKADDGQRETGDADMTDLVVVLEAYPAQQIAAEQKGKHNPEGKEGGTAEDAPSVGEVGDGEELQREGYLDKGKHDLDGVHPTAALGCRLEPGGEDGEEGERKGQGKGKAEHADGGAEDVAGGADLDQQEADDGAGAGEGNQRQREGHEEDAEDAAGLLGLAIDRGAPRRGQRQLEGAEERETEHQQQQEEEEVGDGGGGEGVERAGTEDEGDEEAKQHVDDDDGGAVEVGVAAATALVLAALKEEADRHGDDGPHAGRHQRQQSAQHAG